MAETFYLDYEGLSLYDQNIKDWGTEKNEEIKIKQTGASGATPGKSDDGTILVTPGGTTPATYYTAEEAEAYNTEHSLSPEDPDYKQEGDLKTPKVTTNTNIEVNIDGETLVQDPLTKQIQVASAALTQYIGDEDAQGKYAIAISAPDQNNNKTVSMDINAGSNGIEKTTTGVLVNFEIHPFASPEDFGTNVKEAYALVANGVTLTGQNNEQVIKIYKDSALLDMKLLHAVPATYYTAAEAIEYNAALTGAIAPNTVLTAEQAAAVNAAISTSYAENDPISESDSIAYNATLEGAVAENDVKTPAVKPTYTKLSGWVDIASALRTEANLALCFAYENIDGSIIVEAIQVGDFLRENEFKDGLQVNSLGEVSVKKDATSGKVRTAKDVLYTAEDPEVIAGTKQVGDVKVSGEVDVLTVGVNGVKVNNIQEAINFAASDSKTTIVEVTADSAQDIEQAGGIPKVVITKDVQSDGHYVYTIVGQDLASATALAAEIIRAQSAEAAIDSAVGLTKGANDETRTYSNSGTYIGQQATNTVKSDIKALDTQLKALTDTVDDFTPISSAQINSLFA